MSELHAEPVNQIDGLVKKAKCQDASLRQSLHELSEQLVRICEGIQIHAAGVGCTLAEYAPEEYIYGYFGFSGNGIDIAYRTTEDDMAADPRDPYGPTYQSQNLAGCPVEWLYALVTSGSLTTLLQKIGERLQERIDKATDSVARVANLANDPSSALASSFEQAATALGFQQVVIEWRNAQAEVHTNPSAAITRASSLVEAVCKHVLAAEGIPIPQDQSIQGLCKAVTKALGLDPTSQAEPELRAICQGLTTVTQNIGALRTKTGDAHGRGPDFVPLSQEYARLAVDSAGAVSKFFLQRWNMKKGNR